MCYIADMVCRSSHLNQICKPRKLSSKSAPLFFLFSSSLSHSFYSSQSLISRYPVAVFSKSCLSRFPIIFALAEGLSQTALTAPGQRIPFKPLSHQTLLACRCSVCFAIVRLLILHGRIYSVELDDVDNGSVLQAALADRAGKSRVTVPQVKLLRLPPQGDLTVVKQVYIQGKLVGGNDDLQSFAKTSKFEDLVKSIQAGTGGESKL